MQTIDEEYFVSHPEQNELFDEYGDRLFWDNDDPGRQQELIVKVNLA